MSNQPLPERAPNVASATLAVAPGSAVCAKCAFWNKLSETSGECRRRAPQVVTYVESETKGEHGDYRESVESYTRSEWPETLAAEWCGEFSPNTEASSGPNSHGNEN